MQAFVEATEALGDGERLRALLDRDGYLFLPGLLARSRVEQTRGEVLAVLERIGWLREGSPVTEAVPSDRAVPEGVEPRDVYFEAYAEVQRIQSFHELAHEAALQSLMGDLFGEPVLTQPMKIMRLGVPTDIGWTTPAHQDFPILDGTVDFVTAWVPLGDCSPELGGLKILSGSHRAGRREPVHRKGVGSVGCEVDEDDPGFRTATYRMGDVLVFHSLTVHGALPNRTDRIRLSADFRYQALSEPVRKWILRPHYSQVIPGWDELTRGWTSDHSWKAPAGVTIVPDDRRAPVTPKLVTLDA